MILRCVGPIIGSSKDGLVRADSLIDLHWKCSKKSNATLHLRSSHLVPMIPISLGYYRWNQWGFRDYGGRESSDFLQLDLPETLGNERFSPWKNFDPNRVDFQPQYCFAGAEFVPFPRCQENSARTQPNLSGGFLIVSGTVRRRHRATSTENF